MSSRKRKLLISIVCPVHQNAPQLEKFSREVATALAGHFTEIIFVDDGSTDNSWGIITSLAVKNFPRLQITGIKLARNFGQHNAIVAGLEKSKGDLVVVMDADLQDNPAYIPKMIALMGPGIDVVHTNRHKKLFSFKDIVSYVAHRVLSAFSEIRYHRATGNYKLLSRRAVTAALKYRTSQPVFEVMVERAGYGAAVIDVLRRPREANASSYSLVRSLRFMASLMFSYSSLPAFICMGLGILQLTGAVTIFIIHGHKSSVEFVLAVGIFAGQGIIFLALGLIVMYVRAVQRASRDWPTHDIIDATNRAGRGSG